MTKKRPLHKAKATKGRADSPKGDWINHLVKKTASIDPETALSKQDRIDKRHAKKQRRHDRQAVRITNRPELQGTKTIRYMRIHESVTKQKESASSITKRFLVHLASAIQAIVEARQSTGRPRLYQPEESAATFKKRKWEELSIQPRRNDYGGIGLARQSMFLEMEDPSFLAKLDQEFLEHIPGFFGKQRTKAMKKQMNSKMLWKQMSTKKDVKIGGKRLGDMTPDEQVEAMIKAGMM